MRPREHIFVRRALRFGGPWVLALLLWPRPAPVVAEGTPAKERSFCYRTRRTKHAMGTARHGHVTIDLGQGRIGVFAGFAKSEVEVFDVRRETFQRLPLRRWFANFHGIALGAGKALLVDGRHDCVFDLSVQRFIPTKNTFSGADVRWPPMVALPDGRVFLCGGYDDRFKPIDHCAVFDPETLRFTPVGKLRVPRAMATAHRLADGRILIVGGCGAGAKHVFDTLEIFDLAAGTSELLPTKLGEPRCQHAGVTLPDGRVLLAGGYNPSTRFLRSAEVFDPRTGKATRVEPMGIERHRPRAARLPSGRIAFFGDQNDCRVVEMYCPTQRRFVLADQLLIDAHSSGFTATSLAEGGVLVIGGHVNNAGETLDTAEIFTEIEVAAPPQRRADIQALVGQLGHDEHSVREAATRKLIEMGQGISSEIEPLLQHEDPEIRARARAILEAVKGRRRDPRWCVEVWADNSKQQTLWFDDFSCLRGKDPPHRRVTDIEQAATKHKATHLVVRFPTTATYEQRVKLANLVGWSSIPIIYLGEPL